MAPLKVPRNSCAGNAAENTRTMANAKARMVTDSSGRSVPGRPTGYPAVGLADPEYRECYHPAKLGASPVGISPPRLDRPATLVPRLELEPEQVELESFG